VFGDSGCKIVVARIIERAEVAPIHLEPFARRRFHAQESACRFGLRPGFFQIFAKDGRQRCGV
jgi:hypothetical protein